MSAPSTLPHFVTRIAIFGVCSAALTCLPTVSSYAEPAAAKTVTFIACPIYRDTDSGRKSGCWLADDPATATRYDVSAAPMKPQLGHQVLVEGVMSDFPNACGGATLWPVRTSLLDATCPAVIIPAEDFPGRRFVVPGDVLQPTWVPRTLPQPPFHTSDFHILFDLNSDFLVYQHAEIVLEKAVLYAKASRAKQVQVLGYAQTQPIQASGQQFSEAVSLAQARAAAVAESLRRLGIEPALLEISANANGAPIVDTAAPTPESSKRRVTIRVVPSGESKN